MRIQLSRVTVPVLCYTDTAWGELSVECKSRLQRLQNRAARIIVRRDSTSEALKSLGWPNLDTIRKKNKSILVYKCLNDLVPQYLCDYFSRNHSFHSYNTRRREDIHPSRPKLSLGKRTFRYHFGRKGTPFVYLLLKKRYTFYIPTLGSLVLIFM